MLFRSPLVLTPLLIAFLEMVIDPMCSIVLEAEPEESDVMQRPPRDSTARLLSGGFLRRSLVQGFLALSVVAAIYVAALRRGMPEDEVRALTFVTLVATNIVLIFANRSFKPSLREAFSRRNPSLWVGIGAAASLIGLILSWPGLREL